MKPKVHIEVESVPIPKRGVAGGRARVASRPAHPGKERVWAMWLERREGTKLAFAKEACDACAEQGIYLEMRTVNRWIAAFARIA